MPRRSSGTTAFCSREGSDADREQAFIVFIVPILIHSIVTRELKRLPAYFYRSDSVREPVREWLKSLTEGRLVLLHGFVKKSRKTPKQDIELALKRNQGETR